MLPLPCVIDQWDQNNTYPIYFKFAKGPHKYAGNREHTYDKFARARAATQTPRERGEPHLHQGEGLCLPHVCGLPNTADEAFHNNEVLLQDVRGTLMRTCV